MDTYIGTKVVRAEPMTRAEYSTFRGWALPPDEEGSDEGYLVEYLDGGKPNTAKYDGYVSWTPKEVFARSYRKVASPNEEGRTLYAHKVNPANDLITIRVLDEEGPGGAHHEYACQLPNGKQTHISFQNGPINENGVNGLTQEALLAIVIDRLQCFQAGPYACRENALALTKIEEAMLWLQKRTLDRMRRGVEGYNKA